MMTRTLRRDEELGALLLEDMTGAERLLCSLDATEKGWRAVTAVVDSGAEETVAPPGLFPGRVEVSPMQAAGGRYRAANGARIPNLGQLMAPFVTSEGRSCSLRFQVAGVERPLVSVSQLGRTGHRVEFHATGGAITHLQTGRRIQLQRSGGVYLLKMKVRDSRGAEGSRSGPGFARPRK